MSIISSHDHAMIETAFTCENPRSAAACGAIFARHPQDIGLARFPVGDIGRQHWFFRDELGERALAHVLAMQTIALEQEE